MNTNRLEKALKAIKEIKPTNQEEKRKKGIKLLNLNIEIEKEINNSLKELNNLWNRAYLANDSGYKCLINENILTCNHLKNKIKRARLTISYNFI